MKYDEGVTKYIEDSDEKQKVILSTLREMIFSNMPEIKEGIKWGFPVYSKETDLVYLRRAKNHITLGFSDIDKLGSYLDFLEGDGATMRHIKIKSIDDIDKMMIIKILKILN